MEMWASQRPEQISLSWSKQPPGTMWLVLTEHRNGPVWLAERAYLLPSTSIWAILCPEQWTSGASEGNAQYAICKCSVTSLDCQTAQEHILRFSSLFWMILSGMSICICYCNWPLGQQNHIMYQSQLFCQKSVRAELCGMLHTCFPHPCLSVMF